MIMSEIILSIIIVALLVDRYMFQQSIAKERKEWTKAMIAKTLREITDDEVIQKQEPIKEKAPSEFIEMDDVVEDEALFDKHIAAVKAQAKEEFDKSLE